MKESLERIKNWAKAHPYLAGAILVGVVVLAYITIKRGGGSGGGMSYTVSAAEDNDQAGDDLPLGSSDLSNLGTLPAADPTPVDNDNSGGSGGGFGGGDNQGNNGAAWETTSEDMSAYDVAAPVPSVPSGSYAYAIGAPISSTQSASLIGEASSGRGNDKSVERNTPAKKTETTSAQAKKIGTASGGVVGGKTATKKTTPAKTPAKTPAEKLGKPRYFTGLYNGVRYVLGYPVFGAVASSGVGSKGGQKKQKAR